MRYGPAGRAHKRAKCCYETPVTRALPPGRPAIPQSPHKASQCVPTLPPQPGLEPPYFSLSRRLPPSFPGLSSQVSTPSSPPPPPGPRPHAARSIVAYLVPTIPSHLPPLSPTVSLVRTVRPPRARDRPRAARTLPNPQPPDASFRRSEAGRLGLSATASSSLRTAPAAAGLAWRSTWACFSCCLISARLISGHIEYKVFLYVLLACKRWFPWVRNEGLHYLEMDETPTSSGRSEATSCEPSWWPPDFLEKIESVALAREQEVLAEKESRFNLSNSKSSSWKASQLLWSTGTYSGFIPNGFYSIIPDKKLKEIFPTIPSLNDLQSLEADGLKPEIIVVDAEKDKKIFMLKQLSGALVKGLNNPALVIKKIAGLVFDCFKGQNSDASPGRASTEDIHFFGNRGPQLLGQIRHGSCRPRAILFKVLADAVGLESKLVVGLPDDGAVGFVDSYKHMSVVVPLNSMELLVDLMRFPGQLIPFSAKAIFISHISAAGESDSAENDSCDSPLEPNSPLYGLSDKVEAEGTEASSNLSGRSLRNTMLRSRTFSEGKLSTSCSEPNIANAFWRRSQRRGVAEEPRGASSSPEHPLMRAKGRSILGGDRQSFQEYTDRVTLRSDDQGATSTPNPRRIRRRSISITPEIGDDIVRAVRAMNETLKQNRLQRDHVNDGSCSFIGEDKTNANDCPNNDDKSGTNNGLRNRAGSTQKAMSLPTSPHDYGGEISETNNNCDFISEEKMVFAWNKVLQSSPFNKPLSPFQEWNIDFSELTIGTRVGIGFFGEVFRGIWNGTDVAIKVFLEQDLTTENMEDFCNEIYILSRLRHPNVILFLGACMVPPHLSMVTEYMEMGSLYYLIHMSGQKKKLSWRRRLKIIRDICRGLMCIHRMKIVHRDLKSANCLVNKYWTVKICDFGLSRAMTDSPMTDNSSAGTPEWMAPELIRNEPFSEKCDIFSLGVIMWELCTLRRPWDGIAPVQVVYAVTEGSGLEIPEGPLGKLIADCWAEPQDRPSCQEILTRLLDCEYAES